MGFGCNTASSQWAGADDFHLYYYGFDVATAQNGVTTLKTEAEALVGKPMNAEIASALNEAIASADATKTTRLELQPMIDVLSTAVNAANASIAEYEKIATYIAKANTIDESIAADVQTQYDNGTLDKAEPVFQNLEVATYKYVTENFNYAVSLSSTWNSTGTNTSAADVKGEHWSDDKEYTYKNQFDGWGDPKQGYPANSWTIDFDQEVTLPAGEYVFKVAGRKSVDATLELVVKMGETELGTVNDFPSSNEALGINKAGATSFDADDPAGFAKDGKGYGWQWRYVRFVLNEEATVKVAVHAETNNIYNWVSFGDYTLQMTEETYLEANMGALDAPTAAAEALVDTKPMGTAENDALKDALALPVTTGAELLAKIEALNAAVANANTWVEEYNAAKDPLVAALERFEADYNKDGVKMSKNTWNNILEKVKAAAKAKDVTDSYAGFQTAADNLNAALDAAQTSIDMYANFAAEISYAKAYTPIVTENEAAHNAAITAAEEAYNTAETDDASALIFAMQNFRTLDYEHVKGTYTSEVTLGNWSGKTNQSEKGKSEHWSGDANITYFDYSRWSGNAGEYEATQTITLPAGDYVLMAAGRAATVAGTEAYIKVNDTKVNFAAKGSYGLGIDTEGKANFVIPASDVPEGEEITYTYGRENEGYGWEYRFIEFTLTEETEVTLVAGMNITDSYNPLSWASVCTPVLYTTPLDVAKNNLQTAIKNAENALSAYPVGEEAFQVSETSELYVALKNAIETAQNVLDNATTAEDLSQAIEPLNTAVNKYTNGYVLNAPKDEQRFYIKVATEGHGKLDNAILATLGGTSANNPTGYGLNANNTAKGYLAQAFILTQVEGNLYNISIERPEGIVYLTYGSLNGSAAGWNKQQIQATTDAEKKGEFKIVPTGKNGILKIYNTIDNNYLDCQNGGAIYTDTGIENEEFAFELALEHEVTLSISSAGWATLILPFNAEIPEGVRAFSCFGSDEDNVLALTEATGTFAANTPYLVSGTGKHVFSGYGLAQQDTCIVGLFTGTYVDYQTTANSNTYVLQKHDDEVAFYLVGESAQPVVKPYRIYMTYEAPAGETAAPMFRIGRGATGIEDAEWTMDNGQWTIYDLMGRKVTTMEKGNMYIVNGKKVVIK